VCVCVCVFVRTHLNGRNDVLFAEKCIRLVCEKLTIFPYGQYIVGICVSLAFQRCTQVRGRCWGLTAIGKNVTLNTRKMAIHPTAQRTRRAADDAIIMTYINTQRSGSKYTIAACRAKVKFKVSIWM